MNAFALFNWHCNFMPYVSAPIAAPRMEVIDKYDFHEISLKWIEIIKTHGNGEVLGYRIKHWRVELEDTIERKLIEHCVDIFAPNKTVTIKNLKPYGRYGFTISAFTEGGFGVESAAVFGGKSQGLLQDLYCFIFHREKGRLRNEYMNKLPWIYIPAAKKDFTFDYQ